MKMHNHRFGCRRIAIQISHTFGIDIEEIKSLPYQPTSHPFVERLIKSVRNELTDQTFFYNSHDLQRKLDLYKQYFNEQRTQMGLSGNILTHVANNTISKVVNLNDYKWKQYRRGLVRLPIAA